MIEITCYHCKQVSTFTAVQRDSECLNCKRDSKVCVNCSFYEESYSHACRETQAEWVREKDKSNFCDYFSSSHSKEKSTQEAVNTLSKLESLFK